MSSLKPHKCTAARTRVGAATAAVAAVMGLTPVTTMAAPVNPLTGLGNHLDSVLNPPVSVAAPEGIELSSGGFEVPDSISLPSSSGENTDPNAPKPISHRPDQIARPYPSDATTDNWFYSYAAHPFMELEKNHPEVMNQSPEAVVCINSAAKNDPQAQELALDGDYLDPLANISTAFDANLGQHFRDAFGEGRPPKVGTLLPGNLAHGGGLISSTFFEKYAYGYDRPFVVVPECIERYHRKGQDNLYSTTPSYPSSHTSKAAWTSTMLAMMLSEVAPQIRARASGAGHSRLVMGVHYPLDVMGGRMMGSQAAAGRWADPEFRPLVEEAMGELRTEFGYRCGDTTVNCVAKDTLYMSTVAAVQQYTECTTYDFKQVDPANEPVIVPKHYVDLLETRFPQLTEEQRSSILAQTAIPSGYPLDRIDGGGRHVRINLACALATSVAVNVDGGATVTN